MLNEFIEKILVHERDRKGSIQTTQEVEIYFNFVGRFVPPAFGEVELTPEELEEIRKREERKDRLHQNYLKRKAKAVVFIHDPRTSRFGYQDANLAYQNASLMAECLGVSQFYTGFVCSAIEQDKKGTLEKKLGIDGKIYAGMALGMPAFRYKNYIDRKDLKVNRL